MVRPRRHGRDPCREWQGGWPMVGGKRAACKWRLQLCRANRCTRTPESSERWSRLALTSPCPARRVTSLPHSSEEYHSPHSYPASLITRLLFLFSTGCRLATYAHATKITILRWAISQPSSSSYGSAKLLRIRCKLDKNRKIEVSKIEWLERLTSRFCEQDRFLAGTVWEKCAAGDSVVSGSTLRERREAP